MDDHGLTLGLGRHDVDVGLGGVGRGWCEVGLELGVTLVGVGGGRGGGGWVGGGLLRSQGIWYSPAGLDV